MSPTARTQERCRELGYEVDKAEYWHHYARRTKDLFNFIDSVAVNDKEVILIQSTTGDHHAERVTKVKSLRAAILLAKHVRVEVWSWSMKGKRGHRKLWTLRRERIRNGKSCK